MISKPMILIFVSLLFIPISFAADEYKPYLHKATVPEHPDIRLFGQYSTNLFPGAATYSYPIEVPKGTNNLQPSIAISYNSQAVKQRPGILGAGWILTSHSYIYRDVNSTPDDISDDKFLMILDGIPYELIYNPSDEKWHTEVEYHFKIQNLSNYWLLTKKDGTKYRFGYNSNSSLTSNTGKDYILKWSLDLVEDTHGNKIYYSYLEDPFAEDNGTVYLDKIEYNNDKKRKIEFSYEDSARSDRRLIFEQGNKLEQSRRLTDIYVYADNALVRRHHINYITLNPALSSISSISYYGSDNSSILYNISFDYYISKQGFSKDTTIWKPPVLFSNSSHYDYGVRLIDVNNDGFIDIVQGRESITEKKVWINDKISNWTLDSSWNLSEYIVHSDGTDEGVRFADVDLDGFTDLIKSRGGTRSVYINNGTGWNSSSWSIPIDIVDSSGNDLGVRIADVNGDGKIDLVKAKDGVKNVYLNNGSGWSNSSWTVPEDFISSGSDTGLRIIDLNGDGLADLIKAKNNNRNAWLNNGTGWTNYSNWAPPVDFVTTSYPDNGIRFADVNGDGLVDLLEDFKNGSTINKKAYLNNGTSWLQNDSWKSPEAFTKDGYNIGRRLADINGDGFADIVVSHQSSSTQYSWVKNSTLPYILKSITNEYGGITTINYTTSTQFNNSEDGTSDIGFNIFVVSNVSINNSMDSDFNVTSSSSYNYSFGKYNYENFEFRGFGKTTEITPSKILNHYFYQDDPRRGKEYQTEVYDKNNNIYSKTIKDYNYTYKYGIYNVSLLYSTNYLYDGVLANPKITNKSYTYDFFGNLLYLVDHGDISVTGDEKYYNYSYAVNANYWIMNRIARSTLYDSSNNKIKETKYYYDDLGLEGVSNKGELTKIERWNKNGNNSFSYYDYDEYGNIIKQTDSLGNSIKYSYDTTHTYIDSITNALGHISYYNYDLGTGNLNWEEKNDIRNSYEYDVFGRISKEIQPYDTSESPTKSYSYSFDGTAPESVSISLKTTANNAQDITYFYDGFANLVQIKTDVENNKQIVKNIFYDKDYRVSQEQNPYFADYTIGLSNISTTANLTSFTYDSLDRVIGVLNPDGTSKNITFDHYEITDYDENNNRHKYELDAHGRIIKVYEYNTNDIGLNETYTTEYEYDANDNLIKITDTLGNEFSFTYDSLNRKTAMDDPDLGSWSYSYDTNGNLIRQTDARGKNISLNYDALNRIINKNSSDVNITFSYDKDYYGTLSNLTMNNITFTYEYDDRLRAIKEIHSVDGEEFETEYVYDSQNRLISQNTFSDIDYIFNKQGMIKKIPGRITDSYYNPFGSILNKTYENNLITTYTYNTENNRLISITIPNVQNLTYSYDNVGNILQIDDAISGKNHILRYDSLDRLIEATIGTDVYKYSFNPIGNIMKIVKNNESKKFVYQGNQAHFPSKIIEGNAGVDVYNPTELNTGNKNRTFEFFLVNDKNTSINSNLTVEFGDGNNLFNDSITINDNVMVIVQNNYSKGGDYLINITSESSGIKDQQNFDTKFGTRANNLQTLYSNVSNRIFEFGVHNDITEIVENVSWNCSDGINSIYVTNLTGNQTLYDYISHNYTLPGEKTFACTAVSLDGTESKSITFTIKGLEIENYDILSIDISKRIVSYDVINYFTPIETNISMIAEGQQSSRLTNLSSNENVMVFAEVNYSSDDTKTFEIEASSDTYSSKYIETFKTEGVSIENYDRTTKNHTVNIISFDLRNNWYNGLVNWSINEPDISNSTSLDNNETLMVIVENDNTEQGNKRAEVTAIVSSFIDTLKNAFEIRPLKIESLLTLSEGSNAVSELVVKNNLNNTQQFNWIFNTGAENLTSNDIINISSGDVFIYIASNYTNEGVFKTTALVNSTSYNDTQQGVVVT